MGKMETEFCFIKMNELYESGQLKDHLNCKIRKRRVAVYRRAEQPLFCAFQSKKLRRTTSKTLHTYFATEALNIYLSFLEHNNSISLLYLIGHVGLNNNKNNINQIYLLCHVGLDVSPALFNFAEDGSVAADNGNAGHQEAEQHEELLWRFVVFPDEERKKTTEDQGSIAKSLSRLNQKLTESL